MPTDHKFQPSFPPGRRWKIGFDVVLRTALVLAVVVMVNYLGTRPFLFRRLYLSSQTRIQLSSKTLEVLKSLTNHVEVTLYYDKQDDFYPTIVALLNEYRSADPRITVKTVDYVRDAGEAQKIKEQYKLYTPTDKNLIIFDCEGRSKSIPGEVLTEVKLEQLPNNPNERELQFRRKPLAFNGELAFTSMLLWVTNPKPFKAYFLQGHGEPSLSDNGDMGYFKFGSILAQNCVTNINLDLTGDFGVPIDCNLLIIAGPRTEFSETELQKIDQYLSQGGRLFALFNYYSIKRPTGLEPILQQRWGVNVGFDWVQDQKTVSGQDVVVSNFSQHPVVNPLIGSGLYLNLARPISRVNWDNPPTGAPKVDELAYSSPASTLAGAPGDPPRAYPLMVAVEQKPVAGVANARGTTRILVVGDSFAFGNQLIKNLDNSDFIGYAANWLLDRTTLLKGIGPRPVTEFRLLMTRTQQSEVRWLLLGALPGAVLLFGCLVWLARRK